MVGLILLLLQLNKESHKQHATPFHCVPRGGVWKVSLSRSELRGLHHHRDFAPPLWLLAQMTGVDAFAVTGEHWTSHSESRDSLTRN